MAPLVHQWGLNGENEPRWSTNGEWVSGRTGGE